MLDPLGVRLAGAHHEAGRGLHPQAVGDLHDLEPPLAGLLQRRDRGARAGDEDLGTGAGEGVETRGLDARDRLVDLDARHLRHVRDLGRPERVDRQVGVLRLDRCEHRLVVLDAEVGVVAALQHHLGGAEVDGLAAAAQDLVGVAHPARRVLGALRRTRELARRDAHVCVVDVPVDQVRRDVRGVPEP